MVTGRYLPESPIGSVIERPSSVALKVMVRTLAEMSSMFPVFQVPEILFAPAVASPTRSETLLPLPSLPLSETKLHSVVSVLPSSDTVILVEPTGFPFFSLAIWTVWSFTS